MRAWVGVGAAARAGLFALLPAAAVGGGLALAPLLGVAGAAALQPSLLRQLLEKRPPYLLALIGFGAWAMLSAAWSAYPDHIQVPKLAATAGLGLVFMAAAIGDPQARRLTRAGGLAAFLVLALLLAVEALWNLPLNRLAQPEAIAWELETNPARGAVILLAMGWGVAGGLLRWPHGRWLAGAALALSGVLAGQFHQLANLAGFAIGLGAFGLALATPRLAPVLVTAALALWTLIAPFATPLLFGAPGLLDRLPFSWAARVGIWNYVAGRIGEAPLIGHGLDASRAVTDRLVIQGDAMRAVPLHPHSASLQIWFETGAVGAGLAAAAAMLGGWALARAGQRELSAAACGALASLGFIANVSYGLWQEWWVAAMLLAATLAGALKAAKA